MERIVQKSARVRSGQEPTGKGGRTRALHATAATRPFGPSLPSFVRAAARDRQR